MRYLEKTLLFIALIAVIALLAYSYKLKKHINANEVTINELKANLSKNELYAKQYADRLHKNNQLIKKLNDDYISRKKFDEDDNFIEYKKKIMSSLDNSISDIVKDKPLPGASWIVGKIEFLSPTFIYVEYEDGHHSFPTFLQIMKSEKGYYFETMY